MTTVNKGALIGVLAALLFFVGLTNVEGQTEFNQIQSPEFVSTHGSACQAVNLGPVSYTHLTLPTICSV